MPDGVELGDAQGIGDHRARSRAAAWAHPDAGLLRIANEVGDDEEVAGESHLHDNPDLVLRLLADVIGNLALVSAVQADLDLLDQPRLLALALRDGKHRHEACAFVELDVAALGDEQRIAQCLRKLRPHGAHLGRGLQVEVAGIESESLRVVHRGAGADAQEDVVGIGIVSVHVVKIIRRDEGEIERAGNLQQVLAESLLDLQAMVHDLAEVIARAENVTEICSRRESAVVVACLEPAVHLAARAAGRADETGAVALKQLSIESRLVVIPLEAGEGREPEEIVHAGRRLGPQGHVGVAVLAPAGRRVLRGSLVEAAAEVEGPPLKPALRGVVALEPDDGVDPQRLRLLVELVGAVQIAVIGHGNRRHIQPLRLREEVRDPCRAVEHRVLGVDMQVDELILHRHSLTLTFRFKRHRAGAPAP